MLELHIANKNYSSWPLRPWLLMTALGVPFAEKVHFFTAPGVPNGFSKVSPTGKMPVLYSDGMVIWDSLAIAEFLAETYPSVWPSDKTARAWARSVCAEMHSGFTSLRSSCPMSVGVTVKLKEVSPAVKRIALIAPSLPAAQRRLAKYVLDNTFLVASRSIES